MIPRRHGPILISIPGVSGVSLGPSSTGAVVKYRWPQAYALDAWTMLPRSGVVADLGALTIRMQDAAGDELVTDGQGFFPGSVFLPPLAGVGFQPSVFKPPGGVASWTPRWMPLERHVRAGDQWLFQVMNGSGATRTPELLFRLGEVRA